MLFFSCANARVRKIFAFLLMLVLSLSLAACGGGGGSAGSPTFGGGGSTPPAQFADLAVTLSRSSVSNSGDQTVEVRVTTLDANRAAIGGVPVQFAIDAGGVITPGGTKSDSAGVIRAQASIGADRTNRTIRVTVNSGTISKVVSFDVVDSMTGSRVADLAMTLDRSSLPSDGTSTVLVTVTTLDAARVAVGGAPITFSLKDGLEGGDAFITASADTTTAGSGQVTGTVRLGTKKANRTIQVTATSGTVSRTISFDVVTPIVVVPRAADMTLQLDKTNVGNAGGEVVRVVVTAVDASRNVVANIPVSFSIDNQGSIAVLNNLTDSRGQAKAEAYIGTDKSNRIITITARSEGLVRSASFVVTGVNIQSTPLPSLPAAGSRGNRIEYRVVDINQSAMSGMAITVTPSVVAENEASGPIVKSGVTDANGAYVYSYTAPSTPGALVFSAEAAGKTQTQNVTIPSTTTSVPPAGTMPSPPSLTLSPSVVRVNVGSETLNRTEVRALFLAPANNAPVPNVRVRFDLNNDPNSIGGVIGSGNTLVYTDSLGTAITNYTPSDRASPTNGVMIRACWDIADFPLGSCPNSSTIALTVVADPLSISIGTDNLVNSGASGLTYIKRFVLLVVDSAGNPKSDVQLTPSVDLTQYRKGLYMWNGESWKPALFYDQEAGVPAFVADSAWPRCVNEDTNRNGAIDGAEDINANGQMDPRKSDVSISMVGSTRTDANGTAIMQLEYPKNYASWVQVRIAVAAAGVVSPPAYETRWLDVEGPALKIEQPPPSFVRSPYGVVKFNDGSSCRKID